MKIYLILKEVDEHAYHVKGVFSTEKGAIEACWLFIDHDYPCLTIEVYDVDGEYCGYKSVFSKEQFANRKQTLEASVLNTEHWNWAVCVEELEELNNLSKIIII